MKAMTWSVAAFLTLTFVACGSSTSGTQHTSTNGAAPQTASPPAAPVAREVELPVGTILTVRLDRALSTVRSRTGDTFHATLEESVVIDGKEILPRGTACTGHVTTSKASGRLKGRGVLGMTLDACDVNGQRYPIATSVEYRTTEAHKKRNIEVIGGYVPCPSGRQM